MPIDPNAPLTVTSVASGSQNTGTNATGGVSNQNTYAPGADALRSKAMQSLSDILQSGQLPGQLPQQPFDALNSSLQRNLVPQLATAFGSGSPVIGSEVALANEQLAAQLSREQWGNYMGLFNQIGNMSNTPTGYQQQSNQQGATDFDYHGTQTSTNSILMGFLQQLASAFGLGGT